MRLILYFYLLFMDTVHYFKTKQSSVKFVAIGIALFLKSFPDVSQLGGLSWQKFLNLIES